MDYAYSKKHKSISRIGYDSSTIKSSVIKRELARIVVKDFIGSALKDSFELVKAQENSKLYK